MVPRLGRLLTVVLLGCSFLPCLLAAGTLTRAIQNYKNFFQRTEQETLERGGSALELIKEVSKDIDTGLAGTIFDAQEYIDSQMVELAEGKLTEPRGFRHYLFDAEAAFRDLNEALKNHMWTMEHRNPSGPEILIPRYFGLQRFSRLVEAQAEQLRNFNDFLSHSIIGFDPIIPQPLFKAAWRETGAFRDFSTEVKALQDRIDAIAMRSPLEITDPTIWGELCNSLDEEICNLAQKLMEARTELCREASVVDLGSSFTSVYQQLMVGKAGDVLNGLLESIEKLEKAFTRDASNDLVAIGGFKFVDLTAVVLNLIVGFEDNTSECKQMLKPTPVDTSRVRATPPQIPGLRGVLKRPGAPRRLQGGITFAEGVRLDDDRRPPRQRGPQQRR